MKNKGAKAPFFLVARTGNRTEQNRRKNAEQEAKKTVGKITRGDKPQKIRRYSRLLKKIYKNVIFLLHNDIF